MIHRPKWFSKAMYIPLKWTTLPRSSQKPWLCRQFLPFLDHRLGHGWCQWQWLRIRFIGGTSPIYLWPIFEAEMSGEIPTIYMAKHMVHCCTNPFWDPGDFPLMMGFTGVRTIASSSTGHRTDKTNGKATAWPWHRWRLWSMRGPPSNDTLWLCQNSFGKWPFIGEIIKHGGNGHF